MLNVFNALAHTTNDPTKEDVAAYNEAPRTDRPVVRKVTPFPNIGTGAIPKLTSKRCITPRRRHIWASNSFCFILRTLPNLGMRIWNLEYLGTYLEMC